MTPHRTLAFVAACALPAAAQLSFTVETQERPLPQPWRELTCDKIASHTAFQDAWLWVGTSGGGVYRWDTSGGTYRKWTRVNDGLPDNVIIDLVVDGEDVWIGTLHGLARWDGGTWSDVPLPGLAPGGAISALAVGDDGALWVGTFTDGLFVRNGSSWTHLHTGNSGLSDDFVTAIALGPDDVAWLGVWGDGLDRFDGAQWTHFGPGGSPSSLVGGASSGGGLLSAFAYPKSVDADGSVWIWNSDDDLDPQVGVQRFDGSTWTTYTTATCGIASDYVHSVTVDHDGAHWFQGIDAVSRLAPDGTWTTFDDVPSFFDTNIHRGRSLSLGHDGTLWAGTAEGIARFDGVGFVGMATPELWDADVRALAPADDGSVWFATGSGISGYRHGGWMRFTSADSPLPSDDVTAIALTSAGGLLVGTHGGAALRDVSGQWTVWTTATSPLSLDPITAVAASADGARWFGHGLFGGGLDRLVPDGTWTHWDPAPGGLPGAQVWDIEIDAAGRAWVGTNAGLARFDGNAWTTWTVADGLPHAWVRDVALASDGRLAAATPGGVALLSDGVLTAFTSSSGLAQDITLSVGFDARGDLWAGHLGAGLSHLVGRAWTTLDTSDGLTDDRVQSIACDGQGILWLGTGLGVGAHRALGVPWP